MTQHIWDEAFAQGYADGYADGEARGHCDECCASREPEPKTAVAFCVLCDGTGSFPDADRPCGNCNGLGEVVYIPFPIRRKDG